MFKFTAQWSLKRWLLSCLGGLAIVWSCLFALIALNFVAAREGRMAAAEAAGAQTDLQMYLRGLNEAVLSDGSSSAVKLARESGQRYGDGLKAFAVRSAKDTNGQALTAQLEPAWAKVSAAATALLAIKGLSASDDKSMIAYGRVAGITEDLVRATAALEQSATQAAEAAERRLTVLGVIAAAGSLLALLLIGGLIWRAVFARLGGEPALACQLANRLAAYDLTVEFPVMRGQQSGTVMQALQQIRDSLSSVVKQVRSNAEGVASASAQIADGNQDLSNRTEKQAQSLQETAASTEKLGGTVVQNADSAKQANVLAQGASRVALQGGEVVGQVVQTMKGINDSSRKIADIVGVIDGIAFQTNILALNAAVEAARAGEQGRGFAVVASEVRSLAHRSATAAREIKSLIAASVERVDAGSKLVNQAGDAMHETVASIQRVTAIVGEISTASLAQSEGVSQLGHVMSQMDHATQQNAALVEQSAAAAESMKAQAIQLLHAVSVFKLTAHTSTEQPVAAASAI
jgi:methyl-accepting chemotaxis protein